MLAKAVVLVHRHLLVPTARYVPARGTKARRSSANMVRAIKACVSNTNAKRLSHATTNGYQHNGIAGITINIVWKMAQLKWCMTRSHHRWGRSAHCAARFQRILRALHHPDRRLPGTLRATHSCSVHLARRVSWLYHDGPQSCHSHCRGCCQEHSFHCTGCALLFLNIWGPHGQTDSRGASRNGIRRQCNPHSGARRGYPDCLSASNARPLQQRHPNSVARV